MRFKHLSLFTLIFTLLFATTAPIKAQGPGYAKWLMAGIGCLAATALSYSWLKTGYWGYKISQELPKTKDSSAMSPSDAAGYLRLIKALPELHTDDGVKTFAWGHRIQQKLKMIGIVLQAGSNQANYLRLLHALHLRNQALRNNGKLIPDLRAESEDQFIVWIYQLQQKIKELSDATASPMTFDEQVNAVMLLHQLPYLYLHNKCGLQIILFAVRVQKELQKKSNGDEARMSDKDKKYYLKFLSKLIQEVPAIVNDAAEQDAWIKTLVWAQKLQKELNEKQRNNGIAGKKLSDEEKIEYVKALHAEPELHTDDGIKTILWCYLDLLPKLPHEDGVPLTIEQKIWCVSWLHKFPNLRNEQGIEKILRLKNLSREQLINDIWQRFFLSSDQIHTDF